MSSPALNTDTKPIYNDGVVRQFAIMIVVWGIIGMAVGSLPRVYSTAFPCIVN